MPLILLSSKVLGNSAWPEPGKYKYVISTSSIDKESEYLKQNRKDAFEIREEVLDLLIDEIAILKNPDALTEIINGSKKRI